MKESLVYKGYKIVEQIRMYEVWDGASSIVEYEPEFDAYLIWDAG